MMGYWMVGGCSWFVSEGTMFVILIVTIIVCEWICEDASWFWEIGDGCGHWHMAGLVVSIE
jgi:hypothetical protein